MTRLIDADALKTHFPKDEDWEDYPVNTNSDVCETIDEQQTVEAIPVSYFASELAEIKLILKRKDISKTYREELEVEKRYLVGWINHWRWETGRGCRGWAFQPLSDDEIVKEAMPTTY